MYGEAPFVDLCHDPLQRLGWWEARSKDSNASILSVHNFFILILGQRSKIFHAMQLIGIKLFSVSPSEMCDERTASRLSTFNTAKRNGLSPENLVQMAQLRDHWIYGLDKPSHTHTAALQLPKTHIPPSSICLPTPTLQDLLNPASAGEDSEEPLFICDDPYSAAALEDDNDDESDDEPIITQGSQVERLKIDKLVDLANSKLLAHFATTVPAPLGTAQLMKSARQKEKAPAWSDENWASKAANF